MAIGEQEDVRFFAAGACHILAFAFLETYPEAGLRPVGVWAREAANPMHVYVTGGEWAFDFDGWTPVNELLAVTRATEPDAGYEQRPIETGLSTFCREHDHRDRPYYAYDPWERAQRYIAQFPAPDEHRVRLEVNARQHPGALTSQRARRAELARVHIRSHLLTVLHRLETLQV